MGEQDGEPHVAEGLMSLDSHQECGHKEDAIGTVSARTEKIIILLQATGNAPIMKKKKWKVDAEKPISYIIDFVKGCLKLDDSEKLFLYVNQTFAPSPDQIVKNLYECFGTKGTLTLHYCKSQAWG